jgi:hypothetical protein
MSGSPKPFDSSERLDEPLGSENATALWLYQGCSHP